MEVKKVNLLRRMSVLVSLIEGAFALSACGGDEDEYNEVVDNKPKEIVVTGSAEVHSAKSATLNGYANGANGEIGFCYSATETNPTLDNAKTIKASAIMSDYSYSVTLAGLTAATTYYYRAYGTKDGIKVLAKDVKTFKTEMEAVTGITIKGSSASIKVGETLQLSALVKPDDATDKSVTWSSSNTSVATVTANGLVTAVSAGQAEIKAQAKDGSGVVGKIVLSVESFELSGYSGSYGYVDLGLPSGLKWATCNVGAASPEDYGDCFAWGETEPKSNYDWSTYKWGNISDDTVLMTKYCTIRYQGTVDNKITLEPEDDAAHVNWGGAWRMPTQAEFDELREKCTCTWTSQNGVNGYKVKGPNGNSIFLPAAGYIGTESLKFAGSDGEYWSSSLEAKYRSHSAYSFYFTSRTQGVNYYTRHSGRSVRPVCK